MTDTPVIAITGPTAVGKSAVAEELALHFGVPVISADAMQVYRGMDIATAKTPKDKRRVPLLLVDILEPDEAYSAALYQRDARLCIDGQLSQGKPALLCGGTGLYIRAALDEMNFPKGDILDERRHSYQALADKLGPEGLHAYLAKRDPKSAQTIHPHNVRRVIRALEMLDEGKSYADQRHAFSSPQAHYPVRMFVLTQNRSSLYKRIDARVDAMFQAGLVDEVKTLLAAGAGEAITSRQAIGYKEIMDALAGEISLEDARELIKRRTRRYAKRQLSWCRRDARMEWIEVDGLSAKEVAGHILRMLGSCHESLSCN